MQHLHKVCIVLLVLGAVTYLVEYCMTSVRRGGRLQYDQRSPEVTRSVIRSLTQVTGQRSRSDGAPLGSIRSSEETLPDCPRVSPYLCKY